MLLALLCYSGDRKLNRDFFLDRNKHHIWSLSDSNGIRTHNDLVCKQTLNDRWALLWVLICTVHSIVCYYAHVYELSGYGFKSCCCHLHNRYVENKFSKNIDLPYKAKQSVNQSFFWRVLYIHLCSVTWIVLILNCLVWIRNTLKSKSMLFEF